MDLLQYLIKNKYIDKSLSTRIKTEIKDSNRSLEEILISDKLIPEKTLFKIKSKLLDVPFKETIPDKISDEVFSSIPKESVEYYKIAPLSIDKRKKILEVGMVYPEDIQAQEALKFLVRQKQLDPKVFLISLTSFKDYLERYKTPERVVENVLKRLKETEEKEKGEKSGATASRFMLERLVEEAPIVKMVSVILKQAVEGKASDIHIEPTRNNLKIRYRLDGILHSSLLLPLKLHSAIVARIKILSRLKIDETRRPQDGRFSTEIEGKNIDFRVSTFPTTLGEKVCIRVLDPTEGIKSLDTIGLSKRDLTVLKRAINKPYGMILATGPTGCGKSTTLYAILNALNREEVNIVTLEDPVEYFIDGINQSQVNPDINYTFARGLREILRQDPDIIMVGEIRDEETASLAIHSALTGHLVLSTLHTNGVAGVIPRLIDMGVQPFLIPATLNLVVSQRLVRVLCPYCKEKVKANKEVKNFILEKAKDFPQSVRNKYKLDSANDIYVYKAKGCKRCNFKGYAGREGIFEVLEMNDEISRMVSKYPSEGEILKAARKQGMTTMMEDGIIKVLEGTTTIEEVMRVAEER